MHVLSFHAAVDFLGRAVILLSELKRVPSSRQIIPLTGKPGSTTTSGSVTVEVLVLYITHLILWCIVHTAQFYRLRHDLRTPMDRSLSLQFLFMDALSSPPSLDSNLVHADVAVHAAGAATSGSVSPIRRTDFMLSSSGVEREHGFLGASCSQLCTRLTSVKLLTQLLCRLQKTKPCRCTKWGRLRAFLSGRLAVLSLLELTKPD